MFKATDPQGRSFRDPSVTWAVGEVTKHFSDGPMVPNDAATYLSASTEKADCTGFSWPCRLFEVVSDYVRGDRLDDALNAIRRGKGQEPENYTFLGAPKSWSICSDCDFSPKFGGACRLAPVNVEEAESA